MGEKPYGEYGCYCDDAEGEVCCIDEVDGYTLTDCNIAMQLVEDGKGRNDCSWWRIKAEQPPRPEYLQVTCPNCGHHF